MYHIRGTKQLGGTGWRRGFRVRHREGPAMGGGARYCEYIGSRIASLCSVLAADCSLVTPLSRQISNPCSPVTPRQTRGVRYRSYFGQVARSLLMHSVKRTPQSTTRCGWLFPDLAPPLYASLFPLLYTWLGCRTCGDSGPRAFLQFLPRYTIIRTSLNFTQLHSQLNTYTLLVIYSAATLYTHPNKTYERASR